MDSLPYRVRRRHHHCYDDVAGGGRIGQNRLPVDPSLALRSIDVRLNGWQIPIEEMINMQPDTAVDELFRHTASQDTNQQSL